MSRMEPRLDTNKSLLSAVRSWNISLRYAVLGYINRESVTIDGLNIDEHIEDLHDV